jgi:hypothetical protein
MGGLFEWSWEGQQIQPILLVYRREVSCSLFPKEFPLPNSRAIASDECTANRNSRRTRQFYTAVSALLLEMIANFVQPDYMRRKVAINNNHNI